MSGQQTTSRRRRLRPAVLVWIVVTLAALARCAGPSAPSTDAAATPESAAAWAIARLDPCAPLRSPRVAALAGDAAPAPYLRRPHECVLAGRGGPLVVRVGSAFDTGDRLAAAPTVAGGLVAHRTRLGATDDGGPSCRIDLPLSPTRSMQVSTSGQGEGACTEAQVVAEAAAAVLADPPVRPDGTAWDACDLLATLPDVEIYGSGVGPDGVARQADFCSGKFRDWLGYVSVEADYGPSAAPSQVRRTDGEPECTVTAGDPAAKQESAVHRFARLAVTVSHGGCEDARDVQRRLRSADVPAAGPAPARLGIPVGR